MIQKHIRETGLKQCDLARELGISETHLSLIISGKKPAGGKLALKMHKVFDGKFPIEYFLDPSSRASDL